MANQDSIHTLLQDAIDFHIHTSPDVFPRLLSDIEAASEAKAAGMKAIVIKNHMTATAGRAQIASGVTGFNVFGGIVLNHPVGGINAQAVEMALRMGAKQVWMPTIHSEYFLSEAADQVPAFSDVLKPGMEGISILDGNGLLKQEALAVLDLIAQHDVILGTGHISKREAMVLVTEAKNMGVKKILVTHPLSPLLNYTLTELREILAKGATVLEHVMQDTTELMKYPIPAARIAEAILTLGAGTAILSSDGGQAANPPPVKMLKAFIGMMLDLGVTESDIRVMVRDNPALLLGI